MDHARSCLQIPFFSTTASSRSGCSRCSTGLFNQVAGSWVSSLQSYHSKLAAVLVSSNAMLPVVGSWVFPWPQIRVGQHDLQTGTKAKQKPVLCAKGTTKHNPGIRKRWVLLNFTSKKVTSGVEMFKNCTRLLRKARSEVKMIKTPQVWTTLGSGTF